MERKVLPPTSQVVGTLAAPSRQGDSRTVFHLQETWLAGPRWYLLQSDHHYIYIYFFSANPSPFKKKHVVEESVHLSYLHTTILSERDRMPHSLYLMEFLVLKDVPVMTA